MTAQLSYLFVENQWNKDQDFSSPHNGLTYSNVRKKSRRMVYILVTIVTFCWRNPRKLFVGEDDCHLGSL